MTIENLLSNNLLLSMLSQGGASLAGEGSIAASINPILQSTIAAQSKTKEQNRQAKMLSAILGKGLDFKSSADGKISIGAENISGLIDNLGGSDRVLSGQGLGGIQEDTDQTIDKSKTGITSLFSNLLNPNSSPLDVPAFSDLVGLTPQDITQALAGAVNVETLKQKIASGIEDLNIRRGALGLQQQQAKTSELKARTALMKELRSSPLEVPGLGKISLTEWKNLDTKTKAYSYYAFDAKNRNEEVLPYNEWSQQTDEPTAKQIFDIAKDDKEFKEFYFESKRAGAPQISLGEKLNIKAEKFFTDPKGLPVAVEKFMNTDDVQNQLIQFAPGSEEGNLKRAQLAVSFIEGRIQTAGGSIEEVKMSSNGKIMTWTVKFPSGNVEEISYGVRP